MWLVWNHKKYLTKSGSWTTNKEEAVKLTFDDAYEYLKKGYGIERLG